MSGYTLRWETWALDQEADRRFRRILAAVGIPILIFALVLPLLHLQGVKEGGGTFTAGRYVELLPPQPPAPVAPKQETPKPAAKPQEKPPEQAKPKPKEKPVAKPQPQHKTVTPKPVPKPKPQETARQKAQKLLQNNGFDQLSDLRDQNLPTINGAQPLVSGRLTSKGGSTSGGAAQQEINRAASATSGGISGKGAGDITREQSGEGVGSRRTATVQSPIGFGRDHSKAGLNGDKRINGRTLQEIQLVFDRNKAAFYALYNRALRQSPNEQGKIVVSLTIAADGHVVECHKVYSDLGDPDLERKVIERVKLLNFGAKSVPTFTYPNYPIHFVPPS